MHKKYRVRLSAAKREELEQLTHAGTIKVRKYKRARILLLADEARPDGGQPDELIAALVDLEAFSARMTEKFFSTLRDAAKKADPHHLNLGIRYAGVPPRWAVGGMRSFDVFSMNSYRDRIPAADVRRIHDQLSMPVMIGEYHFGALDVGLPASGIGRVRTQADRGQQGRAR